MSRRWGGKSVGAAITLVGLLGMSAVASADVAVPQTYGAAMRWYLRAAEDGDAQAQFLLAQRYERGVDGPADVARAAEWYARAAGQGHAEAQFKIATMLARGQGLERDPAAAVAWYEKAAAQGFAPAQYNLGVAMLNGEGTARDVDQAFAWISIAAASGLAPAVKLHDRLSRVLPPERIEAAKSREAKLRQKYAF